MFWSDLRAFMSWLTAVPIHWRMCTHATRTLQLPKQHHHRRTSSPHVHHGYNVIDDETDCESHKGLEVWKGETDEHGSTIWGAIFNIITSLVGVGIVGLVCRVCVGVSGWV